jgi:hypothetical protein
MNKQEILEKSRTANVDEGMLHADNRGLKWGNIAITVVSVILLLTLMVVSESRPAVFAVCSLLSVSVACEMFSKFRFTRKRFDLIAGVVCTVFFAGVITLFFITVLGNPCFETYRCIFGCVC